MFGLFCGELKKENKLLRSLNEDLQREIVRLTEELNKINSSNSKLRGYPNDIVSRTRGKRVSDTHTIDNRNISDADTELMVYTAVSMMDDTSEVSKKSVDSSSSSSSYSDSDNSSSYSSSSDSSSYSSSSDSSSSSSGD